MERIRFLLLTIKFATKMFLKLMKRCNEKPHLQLETEDKESLLMQFDMFSQDRKFVDSANLAMFLDNLKDDNKKS
jgi:hypothetical protein